MNDKRNYSLVQAFFKSIYTDPIDETQLLFMEEYYPTSSKASSYLDYISSALNTYIYEKNLNELDLEEMTEKIVINDLLYNIFATKLGLTEFKRASILQTYLNRKHVD
ncbi:hypothetical protein [Halobacteriovorax sp. DA5]|uniref:hypothetical protein n=1 Tax=Halobacteriovorax sp. DA5 TaxID=2067553 RepID=UPI000CD10CD6|nr:hypothetical protein [Halobacteriovorax sp. DA5]POB13856.1 hypothetical protein C0Z22_07290 [Halobacteriovorax sp. DA5]